MSSPRVDSFFSVLEAAPDTSAPGYIKVRRSDQENQKKRETLFDEAKNEGFQAGYDDGYRVGAKRGHKEGFDAANNEARELRLAELAKFAAGLEAAVASIQEGMDRWCELAEAEVEVMAIDIAERVLSADLSVDRAKVTAIVKAAMEEVTHAMEARIRLNPLDSEVMHQYESEIRAAAPSIRQLDIVVDNSIEAGCVIETEGGLVDARTSSQFEIIRNDLRKAA